MPKEGPLWVLRYFYLFYFSASIPTTPAFILVWSERTNEKNIERWVKEGTRPGGWMPRRRVEGNNMKRVEEQSVVAKHH